MPLPSIVRPLALYGVVLYWLVDNFFFLKVRKGELYFAVVVLLLNLINFLVGYFLYNDLRGFNIFLFGSIVVFLVYSVAADFTSYYLKNHSIAQYFDFMARILVLSSFLPLFVGTFQLLAIFGIIPFSMAEKITLIFAMKTSGRITLCNSEPAFAAIYLNILLIFVLNFLSIGKTRKIILASIYLIFLLFTGSSYGYLSLILTLVLVSVIYNYKSFLKFVLYVPLLALFIYLVAPFIPTYAQSRIARVVEVVSNFSYESLEKKGKEDQSFFLRIFNSIIAYEMLKENYFLGVGAEYYYYHYRKILVRDFPFAKDFDQVKPIVSGEIRTTPKNLYAKIFVEFGVIPFAFFVMYIFNKIQSIRRRGFRDRFYKKVLTLFILLLVLALNFDSYIYVTFYLLLFTIAIVISKYSRNYHPEPILNE